MEKGSTWGLPEMWGGVSQTEDFGEGDERLGMVEIWAEPRQGIWGKVRPQGRMRGPLVDKVSDPARHSRVYVALLSPLSSTTPVAFLDPFFRLN